MWIPPGLLTDSLTPHRDGRIPLTTDYYAPDHRERCIAWNDPGIGIEWPLSAEGPILSGKDWNGMLLRAAGMARPGSAIAWRTGWSRRKLL